MSKIKKTMMSRYIILMIILTISLTSLMLASRNYRAIQSTKQELHTILQKVSTTIDEK